MEANKRTWSFLNGIIISNAGNIGRHATYNKEAFEIMLYVLKNGVPRHSLPWEFGSLTTVHSTLCGGRVAVCDKLLKERRAHYQGRCLKNSWYAIDTSFHKASLSRFAGRNPTDRGGTELKVL